MARKSKDIQYYQAIGRRKESVALVRLYIADAKGATVGSQKINKGDVVVNSKPLTAVFNRVVDQKKCLSPLTLTDNLDRFAISIKVEGGGTTGQVEAIRHGLARALIVVDTEKYKVLLKRHNLVTRDSRAKERRKVGTGGKARRQKQSPKR